MSKPGWVTSNEVHVDSLQMLQRFWFNGQQYLRAQAVGKNLVYGVQLTGKEAGMLQSFPPTCRVTPADVLRGL